jgi:hypothetical protein
MSCRIYKVKNLIHLIITLKTPCDTEVATHKLLVDYNGMHLSMHFTRPKSIALHEHMPS